MNKWSDCDKVTSTLIQTASPGNISTRHLTQLVELTMSTGYFQYAAVGNKSGVHYQDEVRDDIVIPYLPHTKFVLDDLGNMAGCYVALSKSQDAQISCSPNWRDGDSAIDGLIDGLDNYFGGLHDDCHLLHAFAVRFDLQGMIYPAFGQKTSDLLFNQLLFDVRQANGQELFFSVWESNILAVRYYRHRGALTISKVDLSQTNLKDSLLLMKLPV